MGADSSYDVVIIGGAAMGSACAAYLAMLAGGRISILVSESDPTYAESITLAAAGGIRQTFTSAENIAMSAFGATILREGAVELAVDGEVPDFSFAANPYLYVVGSQVEGERLRAVHEMRAELGSPSLWLAPEQLARRFPWLHTPDLVAGLLGGSREGTFDPESLLRALRRKALSLGVHYVGQAVCGFDYVGGRISAVVLADGRRFRCGKVVIAAGPKAGAVAQLAGVRLPVEGVPAATFLFRAREQPAGMPIIVDRVQGLNIKPEGVQFLATMRGVVDANAFDWELWPALAHRVPAFEAVRFAGAWHNSLDGSTYDGNPFIGQFSDRPELMVLTGFNGHGLQHAPAAGRALAELIVYGRYQTIDLSRFTPDRLLSGLKLIESF